MFQPAVTEVIVGKAAHSEFKGLNVGDRIKTHGATWTVVGVFTTGGDSHESSLMTDAETLIAALRFWRRLQQMIRLMIGGRIGETSLKPAARRLLAESAGVADFDALKAAIERHAALASAIFRRILPT